MANTFGNTKTRHTRRTRSQWVALISEFKQSDLPVDQFCSLNDVSVLSLNKWRSILKNEKRPNNTPLFVEVTPPPHSTQKTHTHWDIELSLAPGMVLRLRRPC